MHKINAIESFSFQRESLQWLNRKALADEYLIFLVTLYGIHLDSGARRIYDFSYMTMPEMRQEIKARVYMIRAENKRKIRAYFEKEAKKQQDMLRKLSQLT